MFGIDVMIFRFLNLRLVESVDAEPSVQCTLKSIEFLLELPFGTAQVGETGVLAFGSFGLPSKPAGGCAV
jgi:hypothetical protein